MSQGCSIFKQGFHVPLLKGLWVSTAFSRFLLGLGRGGWGIIGFQWGLCSHLAFRVWAGGEVVDAGRRFHGKERTVHVGDAIR